MTDVTTQKPLQVRPSTAGPYLRLPFSQLDEVRQLLDKHGVSYRVGENALSLNEGPYLIVIYLGRTGDATAVQAILDDVR